MRIKGQGYIEGLETAISEKYPSKKPDSMKANGYEGQFKLREVPKLGVQPNKKTYDDFVDVSVEWYGDEITKPGSSVIVKTYEDPTQKAMVISNSNNLAEDKGGKLSWSEMVMSNWHNAATRVNAPVSDLKYIIRNQIQTIRTKDRNGIELETIPAINGAYTAMAKKTDEMLTLDFQTTNKVELQQVSIMSAQTHVARVLQMLKDYRGEFKDLRITKLHLQHKDYPPADSQYNIIIELGRKA